MRTMWAGQGGVLAHGAMRKSCLVQDGYLLPGVLGSQDDGQGDEQ